MRITLSELKKIIRKVMLENIQDYTIDHIKNYILKNNIKQSDISYKQPNFKLEWEEAKRYQIFKILGYNFYLARLYNSLVDNKLVVKSLDLKDKLSNTDMDNSEHAFNNLELDFLRH